MNKPDDSLSLLQVVDALDVGPVRIEKRRVSCPYIVTQNGGSDRFELEYVFGEDVFRPKDVADQNLAAMMTAQVALNYGLFCKEIRFHGNFEELDREFIRRVAENTAREIYVIKFLHPNPFLVGAARDIRPVRRKKYVQAKITFTRQGRSIAAGGDSKIAWKAAENRFAVLSSGGKDSLLSFGLLKELGQETHPIFVNESGRHWFTALNAFRYFKANYSETARVWTNCDRVFSWMLRHLPFVRQDFTRVRSDEYPIRLWTVAVFLFGVLPILKKRGIGRLVIGDEYDTTVRLTHQGVVHYNGLYDQSLYFDDAMTRYFQRKGWGISQFSLLRQLSELLIEKVLAHRYPELQRQQLSCHAAHIEDERVRPCGKCEKCRRIVGMLVALDVDPKNCGYSEKQIEECLGSLAQDGVHQESEGANHLAVLLSDRGLVPKSSRFGRTAKRHAEIMKLRVDPVRSPLQAIPLDLRVPLSKILLQHADGAVKKVGSVWRDFDVMADASLARPYHHLEGADT